MREPRKWDDAIPNLKLTAFPHSAFRLFQEIIFNAHKLHNFD